MMVLFTSISILALQGSALGLHQTRAIGAQPCGLDPCAAQATQPCGNPCAAQAPAPVIDNRLSESTSWQNAPTPSEVRLLADQAKSAEQRRKQIECQLGLNGCADESNNQLSPAELVDAVAAAAVDADARRLIGMPTLLKEVAAKAQFERERLADAEHQEAQVREDLEVASRDDDQRIAELQADIVEQQYQAELRRLEDERMITMSGQAADQVQSEAQDRNTFDDELTKIAISVAAEATQQVMNVSSVMGASANETLQKLAENVAAAFQQVSEAQQALVEQADVRSEAILAREEARGANETATEARFKAAAAAAAGEELAHPQACQDCEKLHNRTA